MSMIGNRKQRRAEGQQAREAALGGPLAPRKRRPIHRWGVILLVVLLLVALLPTLVAFTPLASYLVRRAAGVNGTVKFRSASLGWFSGVSLSGLEIDDAQNQPVLEADRFAIDRSLLKLLINSSNVGTLKIEKPRLNIALTRDGSNLETLIAPWRTSSGTSSTGVDLGVEVTDGEVTIADAETQQNWHLSGLQFGLDMSRKFSIPTRVEASAAIDDAAHPGSITVKSHAETSSTPPADATAASGTDGTLSLQATALPLSMFERVAARFSPGLRISGTLDATIENQWSGAAKTQIKSDITAANLAVGSPALGNDVVRMNRAHAVCQAVQLDRQLDLADSKIETDVGTLTASGRLDLGDNGINSLADLLRQPDCTLQGNLDLAKLARLIPGTLRVRPGTEITSGDIRLTVHAGKTPTANRGAAEAAADGTSWEARLETSHLTAMDHGRPISWEKPVLLVLAAHQTRQGPFVDNLLCDSDFLRITGNGTPDKLTAKVVLNLRKLTDELGRFVDLGGLVLAGDGDGTLQWNRDASGGFETSGQVQLRGFQVQIPQQQPWTEDVVNVGLTAKGRTDYAAQTQLDAATLQLRTASEQVDLRLVQPLAAGLLTGPIPLDLQAQGSLDRWPGRLARFMPMQNVQINGNYRASGQVTVAKESLALTSGKFIATQLAVHGTSGSWSDPSLELTAAGQWDFAARRMQWEANGQSSQEPRVRCVVQCSYREADGLLKIDQCELTTGVAGVKASGQIAVTQTGGDVQIGGNIDYQWDKLGPLLQPFLGAAVQIHGGGTSPISYRGPLSPAQGEGQATLQFSGAEVYGFQLGGGEIRARLAGGILQTEPLELTCNQGTMRLMPQLRLDRQPMEFRMSAGTLARKIQLDTAACRSALMFVVPILASVTQSQGQFSIELDGCRVPMGDLNRAEVAGRMIVHQATVDPGPMVQQMASLLMTPPSLVKIKPESVIQFRMTGGRVYHQGLELQFPELTVSTYGSVGLADESVKIMAQMPVPPKWFAGTPVGDALKKQVVQIPIGGTLRRPQIDQSEIARVSRQVLGSATKSVLQSEIGNQLNRFLGPAKK